MSLSENCIVMGEVPHVIPILETLSGELRLELTWTATKRTSPLELRLSTILYINITLQLNITSTSTKYNK